MPATLRRWLADAQLSLQSHPRDRRKKGMSQEHLELLARLHHRSLASQASPPPPPVPAAPPPLPTALLSLPETLAALQTQIVALQEQIAELTQQLQQSACLPALPAAPAPPTKEAKRTTKPAPTAPRSRSAGTATTKPAHVIPRVEYGQEGHYVVICPKRGVLPFEPDTPEWFAWVAKQSSFRGCRANWATSRLIMSGASRKVLGVPIGISVTTITSCV